MTAVCSVGTIWCHHFPVILPPLSSAPDRRRSRHRHGEHGFHCRPRHSCHRPQGRRDPDFGGLLGCGPSSPVNQRDPSCSSTAAAACRLQSLEELRTTSQSMLRIASSPKGRHWQSGFTARIKYQNKMCQTGPFSGYHFQKRGLFFMLPFFSRTLTRREMALGCAKASLRCFERPACRPPGEQAAGHRGHPLCRHPALPHPPTAIPRRSDRRWPCDAILPRRCPLHRTGQALRRPALGGREPARAGADGPAVLARRGIFFHRGWYSWWKCTLIPTAIPPASCPPGGIRPCASTCGNARHGKNWWCVFPRGCAASACGTWRLPAGGKRSGGVGAVQMREWW